MPIRILITDDHAVVRSGLRALLSADPDLDVVGEAASATEALQLCARLRPDLVLLDITMPQESGIKVAMTRKSAGEIYAQLKAEAANPKGDIWWGGTGDPHLQAAEEGLTEAYKSPKMGELNDWAVRQWEQSKGKTVGVYAGALGYSYNADQLKKMFLGGLRNEQASERRGAGLGLIEMARRSGTHSYTNLLPPARRQPRLRLPHGHVR